jgi:hypothetical protein
LIELLGCIAAQSSGMILVAAALNQSDFAKDTGL